jgi:hypothetical protein
MRHARFAVFALLLAASTALFAQAPMLSDADLLEKSREAGLLTDWHLEGRFGHRNADIAHCYAPEKAAMRHSGWSSATNWSSLKDFLHYPRN